MSETIHDFSLMGLMDKTELAKSGVELAAQLDELASRLHVKSDQHELLLWEADILRAKSRDLLENSGLLENLQHSVLLGSSGQGLSEKMPDITSQVREFHARYNQNKNT